MQFRINKINIGLNVIQLESFFKSLMWRYPWWSDCGYIPQLTYPFTKTRDWEDFVLNHGMLCDSLCAIPEFTQHSQSGINEWVIVILLKTPPLPDLTFNMILNMEQWPGADMISDYSAHLCGWNKWCRSLLVGQTDVIVVVVIAPNRESGHLNMMSYLGHDVSVGDFFF